ncbi:DNA-methyltransferase [Mangrovibrevibacter kandeliae]|uniref:DNA-methyltransferase n=1 Tax=Mangrovibrevibacter kandeliae TaxID=2968473 RepID=UPI0022319121|nr:site-specific DNA-methyltransferase [Aurantimonas sp. MSK8Z-1]
MLPTGSVDSVVTDPPYHLTSIVKRFGAEGAAPARSNGATGVYGRASRGFMGKTWDGGDVAFRPETWTEALRVLKPGGHLLAFGGSKTFHRLAVAIEDAGFEIRDTIMWLYGSGFPKSKNLGDGWGTALKPAFEPIIVARAPLGRHASTAERNHARYGTGGLNIDGCRVQGGPQVNPSTANRRKSDSADGWTRPWMEDQEEVRRRQAAAIDRANTIGRWPANVVHDGGPEVAELLGPAARFFYCAKASRADRNDGLADFEKKPLLWSSGTKNPGSFQAAGTDKSAQNPHPTVKPTELMRWLCRLVTPPGGTVLDPFCGSGSTGRGAVLEGFNFIGIEMTPEYVPIAQARIAVSMRSVMETDNVPQGVFA